jgi:ABC-2 type transport system permease protein
MFLYAGAIKQENKRDDLKVTELVKTRENSGRIGFADLQNQMRTGSASTAQLQVLEGPPTGQQTVAVYIEGVDAEADTANESTQKTDSTEPKPEGATPTQTPKSRPIKAVYVADVDYMHPFFSENRKRPEQFEELDLRVQNITFVLNIVDVLAGEQNYPTIRSHEPQHITLSLFEDQAEVYRLEESEKQKEYQESFNKALQEAEEENQKSVAKFRETVERLQREGPQNASKQQELIGMMQQLQVQTAALERKLSIRREKMETERDAQIQDSRRSAEAKVLELQNRYKMLAIFLPPIPPLIVGAGVFVTRRVREREGISKSRLK